MTKRLAFLTVFGLVAIAALAAIWTAAGRIPIQYAADNAHIMPVRNKCMDIARQYFGQGNHIQLDPERYQEMFAQIDECNKANLPSARVKRPMK